MFRWHRFCYGAEKDQSLSSLQSDLLPKAGQLKEFAAPCDLLIEVNEGELNRCLTPLLFQA